MYKPRAVSCVLLTILTLTAPHIAEVEQLCNTYLSLMPLTTASERMLLIPVVLIVFTMLVVLMVFVVLMMFVVLMVLVMLVILMMLAWLARLVVLMVLTGLRLVYDNHSVRIFCIDIVYVSVAAPVDRLIEVIRLLIAFPLAVAHHSAQLFVAVLPCLAVYVAIAVNGIEIAEVELQDVVALHV